MASRFPQVDLYVYPTVINLQLMNSNQIIRQAKVFLRNIHTSRLLSSFPIFPSLLEYYNIQYSEKQVKRIDENFHDYSLGTKFNVNMPPHVLPKRLRYLIDKSFSGDVSGDIGESLFAYYLISQLNIRPRLLGHLRPTKRRGFLTVDFIIWDRNTGLGNLLGTHSYSIPIFSEVKGFTGKMDSNRIAHGLLQLKNVVPASSFGLLFLAARNQTRQGYDAYVIRVRV